MRLKPLDKKRGSGWILTSNNIKEVFLIRHYGSLIKGEKLGSLGIFKYKRNAKKVMKIIQKLKKIMR